MFKTVLSPIVVVIDIDIILLPLLRPKEL